ncbi:hypothetical protein GQR58_009155 [Nymphon striatum]|nr:hypothetical protein GQR58_009155 [Nymphon striatum]
MPQKLIESSLKVRGPMLFNIVPKQIRNMSGCKTDVLKRPLDKWLANIPDEPQISGYTAMRRAESNSIRHMLPCVKDIRDVPIIPGSMLSHQKAAPSGDLGGF